MTVRMMHHTDSHCQETAIKVVIVPGPLNFQELIIAIHHAE